MLIDLYNNANGLSFSSDKTIIKTNGIEVLNTSIDIQRKRENTVYNALNLKDIPDSNQINSQNFQEYSEKIKNAIYKISDDKPNIDESMRILVDHFSELITSGEPISGKLTKEQKEVAIIKNRDRLIQIIKEFDLMKKNGQKYLDTYFSSINNLGNSFNAEEGLRAISSIGNNILENFNIITDENKEEKYIGQLKDNKIKQILEKMGKAKNDIIGAIGEVLATYYQDMGINIINKFTTSGWGTNEIEDEEGRKIRVSMGTNLEKEKEKFHSENTEAINEINDLVKKLEIESENFKIRTGTEVKADEVYVIITPEVDEGFFYFGISNKTSYSDSKILKIQTTSLAALMANIYKGTRTSGKPGKNDLTPPTETMEISLALRRMALNGVYSNWKDVDFENFKEIINSVLDYYGYIWFTGGVLDKSHADFFSAYSHGKLHFIPMSFILKIIKDAAESDGYFFSPLDINKYEIVLKEDYNDYEQLILNAEQEEKKASESYKPYKGKESKLAIELKDKYNDKRRIREMLYFSRNLSETIRKMGKKGININSQLNTNIGNVFDEITADKIIAKISKSAQIKVNSIHYGIIMS